MRVIAAALIFGMAATPVVGQTLSPATPASSDQTVPALAAQAERRPRVDIVLFGGLVGVNLARVLDETVAGGVALPSRSERVGEGGSVCAVLARLKYPSPCHLFYPTLKLLNGRAVESASFHPDDMIVVPDINLRIERRRRVFAGPERLALPGAMATWRELRATLSTAGDHDAILEYDAYSVSVPVADDAAALALGNRLRDLKLENTSLSERLISPPKANFFSVAIASDADAADALRGECEAGVLAGERVYADWASADSESRKAAQAVASPPSTVVLIDTPVDAGPNLSKPALGPTDAKPSWACKWRKPTITDHGTYLAGIIASRSNGYGFRGVAPNATIEPVPWEVLENGELTPSQDASARVTASIQTGANASLPLRTYLVALDFGIWRDKEYQADGRLTPVLIRAIDESRQLLVVAAGQNAPGVPGSDITDASPLTPQNLGDRDYVIEVTACIDCAGDGVRLMKEANFSKGLRRFVHVAAPGGGPLPGWLGQDGIGLDAGTSPAAAFVAGVVSRMVSSYPHSYANARQVKERVQTTARPLPLLTLGLGINPDVDKLAAGVIDPYVALLDPRESWFRTATGWKAAKLKAVNIALIDLNGNPIGHGVKWLRRLVRTPDKVNGEVWLAVESALPSGGKLGDVTSLRPLQPAAGASLTFCSGQPVPLANFIDILFAAGGWNGDQCGG